ncbi:MAG TPA: hypothetical protein VF618_09605 [Thermoanaerobaculia bacterium]
MLLLTLGGSLAAQPAEHGPARGTVTVNGQTVALRYVYSMRAPNPFDRTKSDMRLVFADRELATLDEIELGRMAGLNAIDVRITHDSRIIGCTLFSPHLRGGRPVAGIGMQRLDQRRLGARLWTGQPHTYAGNVYAYDVGFDPLLKPFS